MPRSPAFSYVFCAGASRWHVILRSDARSDEESRRIALQAMPISRLTHRPTFAMIFPLEAELLTS